MDAMWLWAILGLILLGAEMASATFYLFWFGVAALVIAFSVWLIPSMSIKVQVFLFAVASLALILTWRQFFKKNAGDLRVGQSQGDEIGRVGTITEAVTPKQNGTIQFPQGVMGSREWVAIADENLEVGIDAAIIAIEGNALRVKRYTT
jgi:membrane protein implicated in regulation of membrane protease activity